MDASPSPGLTETLANLSVLWILAIVAGLTVLRLGLIRIPTHFARSTSEILESGIIAIVLVFLVIRPFIVQAYFIPSPSMEPTLLGSANPYIVGDRILVNKFGYRLHKPHHDDVVVFLAPPEAMPGNPDFIKRLIGLPGDRIQVVAGQVTVGGTPHSHSDVRKAFETAGLLGTAAAQAAEGDLSADGYYDQQADYHVKFFPDGVRITDNTGHSRLIGKTQIAQLLGGIASSPVTIRPGIVIRNGKILSEPFIAEDPDYDMTIYNGEPLKHDYSSDEYRGAVNGEEQDISPSQYQQWSTQPTQPIPAGSYLMMGDNRNDSSDGTQWGLLAQRRVVGHAQFIFWPPNRIGLIHGSP